MIFLNFKRLLLESLVSIIIILVITSMILTLYFQLKNTVNRGLMQAELQNIRMALEVYKHKTGHYPQDLRELVGYIPEGGGERWIANEEYFVYLKVDEDGYPIDPFGNRFVYNKEEATVKTKSDNK